jgi:hypothetical protein
MYTEVLLRSLAQAATLLTSFGEIRGSTPGRDTEYPD